MIVSDRGPQPAEASDYDAADAKRIDRIFIIPERAIWEQ